MEILSEPGHLDTLATDAGGKYTTWASMAADESEMELEESDIEALLGIGDLETRSWGTTHEINRYDVARRIVYISAFKRAIQVMIEQALTLDSLDSELSRLKRESRHDYDQREKRLRLAESQARLFRKEAENNSVTVEHLRSQVSSLLAERQGRSLTDTGVIPLDEHEEIIQRLQEESRKRVDSVEAEKGYIAFELSSVRLQLAQLQNQTAEIDYRDDLLDILAEKLEKALARDEEQSDTVNRELNSALATAEQNIKSLHEKLDVTNSAREHAENNATRFKSMFEELHIAHNEVRERLAIVEEAHDRLAEAADENTINDLRSEVEQLKLSLAECERARDTAFSEKETLQVLSNEKQAELETKAKEIEDLKTHIEQMSADLVKVTSERDSAQSEMQAAESTRKSLELQLGEASSRIGTIERERDAVVNETERLKALLEEANKHVAEGKEELRSTTAKLDEALRKVNQALNENDDLRSDLTKEKDNYKHLEEHTYALEKSVVEAGKEFQAVKAEADELRKNLDELLVQQSKAVEGHRLESEEIRYELLKSQNDHAQSAIELAMANKVITELKSDLERANSGQDELRNRVQDLEDKLRKASEDLQLTSQTIEEADIRSHNLKELIESLQSELKSTQSKFEILDSSLGDKQKLLEKAGEEKAHVERDLLSVNAELTKNKKLLLDSTTSRNKLKKELDEAKDSLLEINDTLRQTIAKASSDRDTFNSELDQIRKGLMEAITQQHDALRENEQLRLKLADAEANRADAQQSKLDAQKDRKEALQNLHILQTYLADAQARLASTEQQNERLLAELKNEKSALKKAQSLIERQEAARQRMAAIYGIPTNSPLHSPDRPVPSMSLLNSTPSSSPPATAMLLSNTSLDAVERPSKRGRFARATWPSIETTTPSTTSPSSQPVLSLHPVTAGVSSINDMNASSSSRDQNQGTSVDTAIPLDDDNDVEGSQSKANLDGTGGPIDTGSQQHEDNKAQPSGTKRKKRKGGNSVDSKGGNSVDSKGKTSGKTPQTITLRLTRRRRAIANEEISLDAVRESSVPDGSTTSEPPTPIQRIVLSDSPTLIESCPKDFHLGPNVWAVRGRLARLASWKDPSTSQFICGFCKVEENCGATNNEPHLEFHPCWAASDFWHHCLIKHRRAFRYDAQERAVTYPALTDQSQGQRVEIQQYTQLLAEFVSWKLPENLLFTCGLCQLENALMGEGVRGSLTFDSWANPELFFGHCRTEHGAFWNSELSTSVHLVPDYILRTNESSKFVTISS